MMIGDIERAVVKALGSDKSTSEIPVRSNDSREGFSLPAFFVYVKPLLREHMSPLYKRDRYLISVKYLPHEDGKAEKVSYMQGTLYEVLGMTLQVEDLEEDKTVYLDLNNISTNVDKYGDLTYNFETTLHTYLQKEEPYDPMLHLDPEININHDEYRQEE